MRKLCRMREFTKSFVLTQMSRGRSVAVCAGTEAGLILEAHPLDSQLLGIGVSAFRGLSSSFNGRSDGFWPLFFNRFDQSEFVRRICLSPLERGDEFGMGIGLIQKSHLNARVMKLKTVRRASCRWNCWLCCWPEIYGPAGF